MSSARLACLLVLLALAASALAAEPKRVLVLHSFGRDFAPFNAVGSVFRTELASLSHGSVAIQEISLDSERAGPPTDERPIIEFLLSRADGKPPDLVVTIGAPALRFYLRSRPRLFPQTRLLITMIEPRMVPATELEPSDIVIALRLENLEMAQSILNLRPDITHLALVVGGSQHELLWQKYLLTELAPLRSRIRLLPLGGLTLEQLRQRVATLPDHSAVLYFMYAVGPDGVPQENERALAAVREASRAPVFGLYDSQLGSGIVGGQLVSMRRIGELSGQIASRLLEEDGGADVGNMVAETRKPIFDWRELERWRIPESRLPAGAEVRFRPPSLWDQHKLLIVAGVGTVLFQAVLITALLFHRARRRSAEKQAIALSGRLLTAHEDERKHLAREMHDDLTQRLARLAIDAGRMENTPTSPQGMRPLREDLVRLSEDVHALSYRLHPSMLYDLGLVEALKAECDRVSRHSALRVDVDVDARRAERAARRGVAVPVPRRTGGAEQRRAPRRRQCRDRVAVAAGEGDATRSQ